METLDMHDADLYLSNSEVEEMLPADEGFHAGYAADLAAWEGMHA